MRRNLLLSIFIIVINFSVYCQEFRTPTEGKSIVYFVRYGGAVALIDFKYFDGDKYLGKISGKNYFIYECEPGEHIFWLSAENREFIKGDLKQNATYVIEVRPYMRAVMAGVELNQISPTNKKALSSVKKVMEQNKPAVMKGLSDDESATIKKAMERYEAIKSKVPVLNPDWTF